MLRNIVASDPARVGARAMEEGSTGPSHAIDDLLRQQLEVLAVVVLLVAHDIDQATPAAAQADDVVALAEGAEGHGANCRVQPRDVSTARSKCLCNPS